MTKHSTISATLTRRGALVALAGLCGVAGYGWWARRREEQARLEEFETGDELQRKLEKVVTLRFGKEVSLETWLHDFERQLGMPVEVSLVRRKASEQDWFSAFYEGKEAARLDFPSMQAGEALDTLCELYEVDWLQRDDGVIVVNCNKDEQPRLAKVYPVGIGFGLDEEAIQRLIHRYVEPHFFEFELGTVQPSSGALTIVQTPRHHERIAHFLASLREACQRAESLPPPSVPGFQVEAEPVWLQGRQEDLSALQTALERPITLPKGDRFLGELLNEFASQAQVSIAIHPEVLRAVGVKTTRRTCSALHEIPLHDALRQALGHEEFAFASTASGKLLTLVTNEQMNRYGLQVLRAYPVADFLRGSDAAGDENDLIDVITSVFPPSSWNWNSMGGEAWIEFEEHRRVLIVAHQFDVQRQTAELLTAVRTMLRGERRHAILTPVQNLPNRSPLVETRLDTPLAFDYCGIDRRDVWEDVFSRGDIALPAFDDGHLPAFGRMWCYLPSRPLRENLELLFHACGYDLRYLEPVRHSSEPKQPYADPPTLVATEMFDLSPWLSTRGTTLDVARFLQAVLEPNQWSKGSGGPGEMHTFLNLLVVRCHPLLMKRVQNLLRVLEETVKRRDSRTWRGRVLAGEALNEPLDVLDPDDPLHVRRQQAARRSRELEEKLRQLVSIDTGERNIGEILLELAREHQLPLVVHNLPTPGDPTSPVDPFAANSHQGAESSTHFVARLGGPRGTVSLRMKDKPLRDVLKRLTDQLPDGGRMIWDFRYGFATIGQVEEFEDQPSPGSLYSVDDLIRPRGTLLPRQLLRTIERELGSFLGSQKTLVQGAQVEFHFGNLLWLSCEVEQPARTIVEWTLRELRSGKLTPAPAEQGDADFSKPVVPRFSPYRSVIPVVGSAIGNEVRR